MRVLLIHPNLPPYGGKADFRSFYPPLGLACVAAPLSAAGHEVQAVDAPITVASVESIVERVRTWDAEVVGFRCQLINYHRGLTIAKAIKAERPSCNIVFGGPHMALVAEQALALHPFIDAIVCGEGEDAFPEYLDALGDRGGLDGVEGLVWRDDQGGIIRNPVRPVSKSLDDFPMPSLDILPMHLYRMMNFFALEGHRGCPCACIFCSLSVVQTRKVRFKSPERFLSEMERLVVDYGINRFEMIEPNFTISKEWCHEVCHLILDRGLRVQWIARSYPEMVDEPTLRLMKRAGCYKVFFGIESGSEKILRSYGKDTTVQQGRDAIRYGKEAGLQVYCDFMVGGPGETAETVEETIRFARETKPHMSDVSLIAPFPGTPLYERAEEFGVRLLDPHWYENPEAVAQFPFIRVMELDTLTVQELMGLWVHATSAILYKHGGGD